MKITYAIQGHHSRSGMIRALRERLPTAAVVIDNHNNGPVATARAAWAAYGKTADWHVVLQDDAIPCENFEVELRRVLKNTSCPTSLYFGCGTKYRDVGFTHYSGSTYPVVRLYGDEILPTAVALAMPTHMIPRMLERTEKLGAAELGRETIHWQNRDDIRIAYWLRSEGIPLDYTHPSLVDHADPPSLLQSSGTVPRHALRWLDHSGLQDVIYPVGKRLRNHECLRFSLRTLRHIYHGRVWVAGERPNWLTGRAHYEPAPRCRGDKWLRIALNLRAMLEHPALSHHVLLMNDDFFLLHAIPYVPLRHGGPLAEFGAWRPADDDYRRRLEATDAYLKQRGVKEPLSYELHMPMPAPRDALLEAVRVSCKNPMLLYRSICGNLGMKHSPYGAGEYADDVKVDDTPGRPNQRKYGRGLQTYGPFVSCSGGSFAQVRPIIAAQNPEPSVYEK